VRAGPGRVGLAQLIFDPGQRRQQRLDQVLDRRAAQLEVARRGRVRRPQPPLGDLQEPGRAGVQRLCGQCLEPLGQLTLHQRGPLGRAALGHPGSLLGRPGALVGRRDPAAGEQVSDRCPDENPEQQSDQQQDCTHMQR